MFSAIAHAVARKRTAWIIIAVWLAVFALSRVAPQPKSSTQQQDFLPASDDSIVAAHIANDAAKYPRTGSAQLPMTVIFRDDNGINTDDANRARAVSDYLSDKSRRPAEIAGASSIFTANNLAAGVPLPQDARFLSSDGKTLTMTAFFDIHGNSEGELKQPVTDVIDVARQQVQGSSTLKLGFTGPAVLSVDFANSFKNLNGQLTVIAVILIVVLLVIVYRSLVMPFVPLLCVLIAYLISQGVFGAIASALGLVVNQQSSSLTVVLILGAGTDYTMFIASRFREELREYENKYEAMWHTMTNIGEAIASSALIVVVTLIVLVLASLKFFSDLGPSAALAIACMLVAGLTLVPAVLVLLGRRAFWPAMPRYGQEHGSDQGAWAWAAAFVARRPAVVLAVTGAVFLGLAFATGTLKLRYDFVSNLPPSAESRKGQALLEKAGPADIGKLSPTEVFVTSKDPILNHLSQLAAISDSLAHANGVQTVTGFNGNPPPTADQIQQRDGPLPAGQKMISQDGLTARVTVYLNLDPYGVPAMDLIKGIRAAARAPVKGSGLQVNVGGDTAQNADTRSDSTRDDLLLAPIVFLAIGIILGLLLRSVVAPLYLLASTLLSFFATLGLTSLVFVVIGGQAGIQSFVPTFMAVFLIALGADYNVFIMSRVREEAHRLGLHDGTQRAVARTGGVITSAGLILAGTFAALITLPLELLKEIGFSVAAGVLLDTFVVRVLLVPSIVFLLGRWNWWPGSSGRVPEPAPQAAVSVGD